MLVELGNPNAVGATDDAPRVTTFHFPEADETGQGGYTLDEGMDHKAFKDHVNDANNYNGGTTHLPNHEILLSLTEGWKAVSKGRPTWVKASEHANGITPAHHVPEVERFLSDYFEIPVGIPEDIELTHHTKFGPPGVGAPEVPVDPLAGMTALFTNGGRTAQSLNYGGGQVGAIGTGTAATGTTFTTNLTLTTNAWAGYRIYVYGGSGIVWGNILSNTNAASAAVVTVDRWYNAATPGGAAATTPASSYYFILADGGNTSAWFVGLTATTSGGFTAADTTLSGEIVTGGGGLIRKISPFAITSSTSPGTYTLTPVFTANGSDSLPVTVASAGAFSSMVVGGTTGNLMRFESALSSSATFTTSGDNATLTWTVTES